MLGANVPQFIPYQSYQSWQPLTIAAPERPKPEGGETREATGGLKYDDDKPRMDLLDPEWLEGVADILGFGAKKYAAHNWRKGIPLSRLYSGIQRHLNAIQRGEDIDPESGMPHIWHASCGCMFYSWTMKHLPDMDDRFK